MILGDGEVHVDFRKWPDTIHWQFRMRRLGEDEHGIWLWAPGGTVARRAQEPPKRFGYLTVKVVPRDRWWTAIFNDGASHRVYVDIITPAEWSGDTVTMIDLDLDVVCTQRGDVFVEDEDEFLEHQVTLGYPDDVVARARTTAAQVAQALEGGHEPFAGLADAWLEAARSLDG